MLAPMIWYFLSKLISVYFPNRLLLSFLVVFAFPIACEKTTSCHQVSFSIYLNVVTSHFRIKQWGVLLYSGLLAQWNHTSVMGLDARTLSSTRVLLPDLLTTAKYLMAYRADTVLPAPDSPLTMIDWFLRFLRDKRSMTKVYVPHFVWLFWDTFTCPSACRPPLPLQICEDPCLPCSGLSRREWLHLHRYEVACMDLQPPI